MSILENFHGCVNYWAFVFPKETDAGSAVFEKGKVSDFSVLLDSYASPS